MTDAPSFVTGRHYSAFARHGVTIGSDAEPLATSSLCGLPAVQGLVQRTFALIVLQRRVLFAR